MILPNDVYNFLNSPERYMAKLQQKFGDPFPFSMPRTKTIWLTSKPELVKSIFNSSSDSFKCSENNPVGPLLGKSGLIMQSGVEHLNTRKTFSPFFSKNNLKPFAKNIIDIFISHQSRLSDSGTISLQEFSFQNTLEIILTFLFPGLRQDELQEAVDLTEKFLNSYSAFYLFIPQWIPFTWKNFNLAKNDLDIKFYKFYQEGKLSSNLSPIFGLENATKYEILDHIRTFIVAGHETSATSLCWALYYIYKNKNILQKLQNEMPDNIDLDLILSNSYLDNIVQETFRIHPPVPFITRKIINRPFNLGNINLNIDDELGVCIYLLHQNNQLWQMPSEFNPDNFLDCKFTPFEFAPFGGGVRKCIGAELAILEIKILVYLFLKNYKADLVKSEIPQSKVMQITIGPKNPIYIKFQKN